MDKPGHIVFMLQPGSRRSLKSSNTLSGFSDGLQSYFLSVVLQVLDEQHGVVPFLLGWTWYQLEKPFSSASL